MWFIEFRTVPSSSQKASKEGEREREIVVILYVREFTQFILGLVFCYGMPGVVTRAAFLISGISGLWVFEGHDGYDGHASRTKIA